VWRFSARLLVTMAIGLAFTVTQAGAALAGGPGTWTRIGVTSSGFNQAGLLRTADGRLHVVWQKRNANGTFSYSTATLSRTGKLVGTGAAVSGWSNLEGDPRLVRSGSGLRLVLLGNRTNNASDFFSRGAVYTATSASGSSWSLVHGSMAQHVVLNLGLAATADASGTPVAAFGLNNILYFHPGVDANAPASGADGSITGPGGTGLVGPALVKDKDGSVWLAWFHLFGSDGYWVNKILPAKGAQLRAPGSGGTGSADNEPRQQVALAARSGGGVYLAYCSPTSVKQCAHIDLWKVGSARPMIVPGSGTGSAGRVALAAGPGGRLSVAWFDFGQNKIHVIRTNARATRFGVGHTVSQPPKTILFNDLQVEGTSGRQDIIANVTLSTAGNPATFWQTQVLAGLKLAAKPGSFSRNASATVTFTVTDAGDPVAAAHVSCIGKSGTTNSRGQVRLTFARRTSAGRHTCTATRASYAPGKTTISVR
jgi:hypothetical protein